MFKDYESHKCLRHHSIEAEPAAGEAWVMPCDRVGSSYQISIEVARGGTGTRGVKANMEVGFK